MSGSDDVCHVNRLVGFGNSVSRLVRCHEILGHEVVNWGVLSRVRRLGSLRMSTLHRD